MKNVILCKKILFVAFLIFACVLIYQLYGYLTQYICVNAESMMMPYGDYGRNTSNEFLRLFSSSDHSWYIFSFCSLVVTSVFSAFGTSFRFIYESFFSIKFLLTCREHKLASAIFADEFFVLVHSIFSLGCNKPHRTTLIRCILYFNPYFEFWQPQNFSGLNLIYK